RPNTLKSLPETKENYIPSHDSNRSTSNLCSLFFAPYSLLFVPCSLFLIPCSSGPLASAPDGNGILSSAFGPKKDTMDSG
ncbi:hypothetical protein, partial [Pedobacter sp. UYEF25]